MTDGENDRQDSRRIYQADLKWNVNIKGEVRMGLGYKNNINTAVTAVSNTFIDEYMGTASGEYVKVYLYLLRHAGENVEIPDIAEALNHTEADVRRALAYWERAGVLASEKEELAAGEAAVTREDLTDAGYITPESRRSYVDSDMEGRMPEESAADSGKQLQGSERGMAKQPGTMDIPDAGNSYDRMKRLSADEEFSALLYAVQQYLGKTFSAIECEKFAYFYDVLHMSCELLEYLAEYCAEGGHTSIRYIEKVALNWYQAGIHTRDEAREHSVRYSKDTSAVMKAFGIMGRNAGTAEQEFIRRWFKEFGFDSMIVTEACNRTLTATGSASFPYADKILAGWKENGVRTLQDVDALDKRRQEKQAKKSGPASRQTRNTSTNRFNNFEQRSYNYDDYVWDDIKNRK